MTTQRDSSARAEALAIIGLGILLIAAALLRQDFIGDGVRHVQAAVLSSRPPLGRPRWLLFPALAWAVIHPLAAAGLLVGTESAIRALLFATTLSGLAYLWAIRTWLRAEGVDARLRTAGLILAASTMPFLVLYTDIAEVQVAAALVVVALAASRARTAAGAASGATVLGLAAVIAVASLVYQGLIVAMACVPLVVPREQVSRKKIVVGWAAILLAVPLLMILARISAGDAPRAALETTAGGEANPLARASMAAATPAKWAVAFLAGPPQAMIRLSQFQGLPALVRDLRGAATRDSAVADAARLAGGLILVWAIVFQLIRTRDWRLAVAMLAVVALPMVRNNQYNYPKFYVLWPALIALASTRFPPRWVLSAGGIVLVLNGVLLANDIRSGRRSHAEIQTLYLSATPDTCFFTSGWSAPFPYLWPGETSAIISDLWRLPGTSGGHPLTASLGRCFCNASSVWTDTTAVDRQAVQGIADQLGYTDRPVAEMLYRNGDGLPAASTSSRIFVYSRERQAALCRLAAPR